MPTFRTLEDVAYIDGGKVVSVARGKNIELTEAQAKKLGAKIQDLTPAGVPLFPKGAPIIDALRTNPESA